MNERKRVIAIIPARSGSKGLKNKNIKELKGKPLMGYTIEAAIKSGIFDTVHVSTDSRQYAEMATSLGADVPFLRSVNNSCDTASSWDVVREVLEKYEGRQKFFDICVLLQPTSPMRDEKDICAAFALFGEKNAKSLTSVTEVDHPIQWCFTLDETLSLKNFAESKYKDCRRQELQKHYRENGAIYIVGVKDIKNINFNFYNDESIAFIMKREKSVDIDTRQDFIITEALMNLHKEE